MLVRHLLCVRSALLFEIFTRFGGSASFLGLWFTDRFVFSLISEISDLFSFLAVIVSLYRSSSKLFKVFVRVASIF